MTSKATSKTPTAGNKPSLPMYGPNQVAPDGSHMAAADPHTPASGFSAPTGNRPTGNLQASSNGINPRTHGGYHHRTPYIMPPLSQVLFGRGGNRRDGLLMGKYYAVNPDGSTGGLLGSFDVRGDWLEMNPAGGGIIQVAVNDAPKDGKLSMDYGAYRDNVSERPEFFPGEATGFPDLGTRRINTPHDYDSQSSGNLTFSGLGGPTVDADMQQLYRTISNAPTAPGTTTPDLLAPQKVRFVPD